MLANEKHRGILFCELDSIASLEQVWLNPQYLSIGTTACNPVGKTFHLHAVED